MADIPIVDAASYMVTGPDDTVPIQLEPGETIAIVMHDHIKVMDPEYDGMKIGMRIMDEGPEQPTVYPAFLLVVKRGLATDALEDMPPEVHASLYAHLVEGHRKNLS